MFGIGAAIGGIAQGLGSAISASKTNKANLKINQMNNDFNREEAQKARNFQVEQWERENAYNTPANQRKRLQEAGYNPYFDAGVNAGSAAGASSTTAATAATAAPQQPINFDFAGPIALLSQASKMMSEKKNTDMQTMNYTDLVNSQIWKNIGSTDWRNASPEARKYNMAMGATAAQLQMNSLKQNWSNQVYEGALMRSQIGINLLDAKAKSILNKHLDAQQLADLNLKAATYELRVQEGQMKPQELRESLAREAFYAASAAGRRIDNRVAGELADSVIKAQRAANIYGYNYNVGRNKFVGREVEEDVKSHTWQNALTGKMLNAAGFDERMRGWREAINSANMLLRGAGSVVGMREDYLNGKYNRGRPYTSDFDEYTHKDKHGNTERNRRYR
uniref:DNA pilot protein n=1 Tax=Dulem virus 256 TaxID=3145733 RepID=A0AAU8B7Q0_9VIRU